VPQFSESQIDDLLRRVPVPSGLHARLKELRSWEGEMLDEDLADVTVPDRVKVKLKRIPADDALDRMLTRVEAPADLATKVKLARQTNWGNSLVSRSQQFSQSLLKARFSKLEMALAASLLLAFLISLGGALGVIQQTASRPSEKTEVVISASLKPREVTSEPVSFATNNQPTPLDLPEHSLFQISLLDPLYAQPVGPYSEVQETMLSEPFGESLVRIKWGLLGFPSGGDLPVEFEGPSARREAGLAPPLVPKFDRRFLIRQGIYPVVDPSVDQRLQTSSPPLIQRTDSFHETARLVKTGKLPETKDVRLEEFVAAMPLAEFVSAPKTKPVDIRVAAGPAPFSGNGAQLLQVTVAAADPQTQSQPAHFIIAIDASQSAAWHGRWEGTKQAVLNFVQALSPSQVASVIVFREEAFLLAERATAADVSTLRERLDSQAPSGTTDLAAAMSQAFSLAGSDAEDTRSCVVMITDDQNVIQSDRVNLLGELLADGLAQGIEVTAVRMGPVPADTNSFLLENVAADASLSVRNCVTEDDLNSELAHVAFAGQELAHDVNLSVHFKPEAVAGYRLLGHSPTSLGGLSQGATASSFGPGQTATVLYEVWLKDDSAEYSKGIVADVELRWLNQMGENSVVRQPVSRLQFAKSFRESLPSLQAAAFAAETAQYLQRSPFRAHRKFDLADLELLEDMFHPAVAKADRIQALLKTVRSAERLQARQ
jgi:hypothetical protein